MEREHPGPRAPRTRRAMLIALMGIGVVAAACSSNGNGGTGGNASPTSTPSRSTTSSTGPTGSAPAATPVLTSALTSAYEAETAALATYRNVVSTLGSVRPFPNVIEAEQRHVAMLTSLFSRYGIPLPAAGTGQSSPSTRTAACGLGVTVERGVIELYNTQLPKVAPYADVTASFKNLLAASQDDHLPAFQHCA